MPRLPRHQRTASQGGEKKLIMYDIVCVCMCSCICYQNTHSTISEDIFGRWGLFEGQDLL